MLPILFGLKRGVVGISAHYRVPTQIVFSNSLCFPRFFPVQPQIFPVPIYIICNYYIHKTMLADLFSFWKKEKIFAENIAISFPFRIREFYNLMPTKFPVFPVFWQNFQIPCVFFWPFSLFYLCHCYLATRWHHWCGAAVTFLVIGLRLDLEKKKKKNQNTNDRLS